MHVLLIYTFFIIFSSKKNIRELSVPDREFFIRSKSLRW